MTKTIFKLNFLYKQDPAPVALSPRGNHSPGCVRTQPRYEKFNTLTDRGVRGIVEYEAQHQLLFGLCLLEKTTPTKKIGFVPMKP